MRIDIEKKWNFGNKQICLDNLKTIQDMIHYHIWCPPPRPSHGIHFCNICENPIDLDKRDVSYYAVWVGLICGRCSRFYEKEIEEMSRL